MGARDSRWPQKKKKKKPKNQVSMGNAEEMAEKTNSLSKKPLGIALMGAGGGGEIKGQKCSGRMGSYEKNSKKEAGARGGLERGDR